VANYILSKRNDLISKKTMEIFQNLSKVKFRLNSKYWSHKITEKKFTNFEKQSGIILIHHVVIVKTKTIRQCGLNYLIVINSWTEGLAFHKLQTKNIHKNSSFWRVSKGWVQLLSNAVSVDYL
jgi:hypothetical protein